MILRTPATLDVVKVASLVYPDDADQQAEFVSLWLQEQQHDTFIDLVAVHKKKIMGFFAGTLHESHLTVLYLKAETKEILTDLWNKVTATHEVGSASVTTGDPDLLMTLGFEPVFTVMQYTTEKSDS